MNLRFTGISCILLAIDEVGGVPFEILEPVLERCTPEQLYRIEQCNPVCVHILSHNTYLKNNTAFEVFLLQLSMVI